MRYQIPQFIEIEDKIFGPLTLKQFLYVLGGGAIGFLLWSFIPIRFIAFIVVVPVVAFFMSLAFYEHNGRPFIYTVENAFKFTLGKKLYVWKKKEKKPEEIKATEVVNQLNIPKISDSKLKELTWTLDINTKLEKVEKEKNLGLKI